MTKDASKATEKFSAVGGSTRSLEVLVGVILRGGLFFGSVLIVRFRVKKASDMLWQRNLRASAKVPGNSFPAQVVYSWLEIACAFATLIGCRRNE